MKSEVVHIVTYNNDFTNETWVDKVFRKREDAEIYAEEYEKNSDGYYDIIEYEIF